MNVYEKLDELGLILPPFPKKGGVYAKVKRVGNLLYISGQGPTVNGEPLYTGKLGSTISFEDGQEAAKACALNVLSCLEEYLGDLNQVKNIVKILAFVASAEGFTQQPQVVNSASQLFIDVFGEAGEAARSAIGTNELPGNIPVEIEAIVEVY